MISISDGCNDMFMIRQLINKFNNCLDYMVNQTCKLHEISSC